RDGAACSEQLRRCELPGDLGMVQPVHQFHYQLTGAPETDPLHCNTSAAAEHIGGNEKLASAGFFPRVAGFGAAVENVGRIASIAAHENVLNRMSASAGKQAAAPAAALPTDTYFDEFNKLPAFVNGEAVILYYAPAANTDGDSIVFFR